MNTNDAKYETVAFPGFSRVGIYFLLGLSRINLQKHPGKISFQGSIFFPGFSKVVTTLLQGGQSLN